MNSSLNRNADSLRVGIFLFLKGDAGTVAGMT